MSNFDNSREIIFRQDVPTEDESALKLLSSSINEIKISTRFGITLVDNDNFVSFYFL